MKRLTALLVLFMLLIISSVGVVAEGIYVSSASGDRIRILEDVEITEPIRGNSVTVLGNVTVGSNVGGHVITVFGDANVDSVVSGHVVSLFGNTVLKDNAKVMGDVITVGSLTRSAGAVINGQEVRILGESMNLDIGALFYLRLIIVLLYTLAVFIMGTLAQITSRRKYLSISRRLEINPSRKFILGLLVFAGASTLLLLMMLTLIAPLIYMILLLLASVPAFMYLGRKILKSFSPKNGIFAEFVTGLVTVTLIKLILIFAIPQQSILVSAIIIGIMNICIYSIGLGIMVEQYYLKNSQTGGGPAKEQGARPQTEGAKPEEPKTEGTKPEKPETEAGA